MQPVQDRGQGLFDIPLLVGIVDAEDELPPVPPGEKPAKQRGSNTADVQIAGGAGGKSRADGHFGGGQG